MEDTEANSHDENVYIKTIRVMVNEKEVAG
jgi:hypothetical protein